MSTNDFEAWLKRFWFLRGVAAAMLFASLIPQFTDLSRFEALRVFHALLIHWDSAMQFLGELIGELPWVPVLPAKLINLLIFISSISIPIGVASARVEIEKFRSAKGGKPNTLTGKLEEFFDVAQTITFFCVFPLIGYGSLIEGNTIFARASSEGWLPTIFYATLVFTVWGLVRVARVLHGYFQGLVFVVTFMVAIEILYLLNTPWLADHVRALTT